MKETTNSRWKIYVIIIITLVIVEGSIFFGIIMQRNFYVDQVTFRLNKVLNILHKIQTDQLYIWQNEIEEVTGSEEFYNYVKAIGENSLTSNQQIQKNVENYLLKYASINKQSDYLRFINSAGEDILLIKGGQISYNYISHKNDSQYLEMANLTKVSSLAFSKGGNDFDVIFAKPVYYNNKKIGIFLISHKFDPVTSIFDKLTLKGLIDNVFITDKYGNILYSNDINVLESSLNNYSNQIPEELKKEGKHLYLGNIIFTKNDEILNGKIFIVTYKTTIQDYTYTMIVKSFSASFISGILILIFFIWIIRLLSEEFKVSVKEIESSENYMKAVLYMMNNLLFIIDAETLTVEQTNQAVFILLGYNEEDIVGKSIITVLVDNEETKDKVNFFKKNKVINNLELQLKSKNGIEIPVILSSSIIEEYRAKKVKRKLICVALDISKQKEVEKQLNFIAHHDALTNLANRVNLEELLESEMNRALRVKKKLAIFYLDLDEFKAVNDTYGHDIGDELLIEFSKRLNESVRKEDTVFRIGGDEFIIVITNVQGSDAVKGTVENLIKLVNKPFDVNGASIELTVSIGISIFPTDAKKVELLVKKADIAMYEAKTMGKNTYKFFDVSPSETPQR